MYICDSYKINTNKLLVNIFLLPLFIIYLFYLVISCPDLSYKIIVLYRRIGYLRMIFPAYQICQACPVFTCIIFIKIKKLIFS